MARQKPDNRWARAGALGALALYLGYLETFVPIPIPGVRLGLANVAILIALAEGDVAGALLAACVKVLASAVLFGTPVTLAYSAAGTILSLAVMVPLSRLATMRVTMLSITGALAHVIGQIAVAGAILGTTAVWYGAPVLAVGSCVTGALSGLVAERACALIRQDVAADAGAVAGTPEAADPNPGTTLRPFDLREPTRQDKLALMALVALVLLVLWARTPVTALACLACAAASCLAARVTPHALVRAVHPLIPMLAIAIVAQALAGGLDVSQGVVMAARLGAVALGGVSFASSVGTEGMAGLARWIAAPLGRLGLDMGGVGGAFEVALGVLPVLMGGGPTGDDGSPGTMPRPSGIKGTLDALPQVVALAWSLAMSQGNAADDGRVAG